MQYVITGSTGNISKPVTEALVKAGHAVTVITSNPAHTAAIESLGAKAAVGSVEDVEFLAKTFTGADAVYTMVPPKWDAADWKSWIGNIGNNYARAIAQAGVKYVVNLSSVGAHMPDGCGPVSGLYRAEQALNTLAGVNILHLRPSYFYTNLLANINMVKHAGIIGSNFSVDSKQFPVVHPSDIADVAAESLLQLAFKGHSVCYIASDEVATSDIAAEIGKAIGNQGLQWVAFTNEQAFDGMKQAGLSDEVVRNYVEMGAAVNDGTMSEDYWKNHPSQLGKIKLADFAQTFAAIYSAS